MTASEINAAIAESVGIKRFDPLGYAVFFPDYHGSLDAIVPVVRALDDDSRCQVVLQLVKITIQGPMFAGYFATAAQWCEAYLKSLNLWK